MGTSYEGEDDKHKSLDDVENMLLRKKTVKPKNAVLKHAHNYRSLNDASKSSNRKQHIKKLIKILINNIKCIS